jgi:predicted benzoate:H+ symporter BenE
MTTAQKQAMSAALVAAGFLVLGLLQAYVVHLPTEAQIPIVTFLGPLAHLLPTMGTAEATAAKVDDKARAIVADVLDAQDAQGRP